MTVVSVDIRQFRNIKEQHIEFSPGVNLLKGDNAQGKTNALEALYYFASAKSFRGVRDREAVMREKTNAYLKLGFSSENDNPQSERFLEVQLFTQKRKELKRNGVVIPSASDFVGSFRAVLFCPEHLQLVKGAPQTRRTFIDTALCQLRPTYLAALNLYAKLLKQKNALLKNDEMVFGEKRALLDVLNEQLSVPNAHITALRQAYIKELAENAKEIISDMTKGKEKVEIDYISDTAREAVNGIEEKKEELRGKEAYLRKCFERNQEEKAERELYAGMPLSGCHRDDLAIRLDGEEAKLYASQGQDRSIALALKLAEGEISRKSCGEYPVFLFDDVLSELDEGRQAYLMGKTQGKQVIMTACGEERGKDVHCIEVCGGCFSPSMSKFE